MSDEKQRDGGKGLAIGVATKRNKSKFKPTGRKVCKAKGHDEPASAQRNQKIVRGSAYWGLHSESGTWTETAGT